MKKTNSPVKKEKYFGDIAEFYRVALKYYIEMHTEKRFKLDVFEELRNKYPKMAFSGINNFIKKKSPLSEKKRIQIASFLDFKYEEFIALGRKLAYLQENNMLPYEPGIEAFYSNQATANILKDFQEKHNLSDRNVATCLDIDLMDYTFKKKGLIPFSFDEVSTVFQKAGETC